MQNNAPSISNVTEMFGTAPQYRRHSTANPLPAALRVAVEPPTAAAAAASGSSSSSSASTTTTTATDVPDDYDYVRQMSKAFLKKDCEGRPEDLYHCAASTYAVSGCRDTPTQCLVPPHSAATLHDRTQQGTRVRPCW